MPYRTLSSAAACSQPVEEVCRVLQADPRTGHTAADLPQRRAFHGANELSTEDEAPLWAKFLEKLKEPMVALLLGSAFVSVLTKQYDDAISITLVSCVCVCAPPARQTAVGGGGRRARECAVRATHAPRSQRTD
jgi:Ca2+-transporting ATPase